jgi:hypothetical protein
VKMVDSKATTGRPPATAAATCSETWNAPLVWVDDTAGLPVERDLTGLTKGPARKNQQQESTLGSLLKLNRRVALLEPLSDAFCLTAG